MNGKSAKLLRRMKSTSKRNKQNWSSLPHIERGELRRAAADPRFVDLFAKLFRNL